MPAKKNRKRRLLIVLTLGVAVLLIWLLYFVRYYSPTYDSALIAQSETRMWQAYYSRSQVKLGYHLVSLLRSQYGLSYWESKAVGESLAKSAMAFLAAKGDYERVALPDLIRAYALIKEAIGGDFDPEEVARAELAWWVARRTPGEDSPEQVGQKIARQYALLCGSDHPSFQAAGLLRARAARLRDMGGTTADWAEVEKLLVESYKILAESI